MKHAEFLKKLTKGKVPRLILLVGDENHFKDKVLKAISKRLFEDDDDADLGTVVFEAPKPRDAEKLPASRIFEEVQTIPMLAENKLVVVHYAERILSDQADVFFPEAGRFMNQPEHGSHLVLFVSGAVARITKKIETLGGTAVACKKLYDSPAPWKRGRGPAVSETAEWLSGEARELGHSLSPQDAEILVKRIGGNLAQLKQELDQLSLLAGKGRPISSAMVDSGEAQRTQSAFKIADAVIQGDCKQALTTLHEAFSQGLDMGGADRSVVTASTSVALIVLNSLFRRFINLYQGARLVASGHSPASAADHLGIKGFPARKFEREVSNQRLPEITEKMKLFRQAESDLKGGSSLSTQLVLERLVIELIQFRALPASTRVVRRMW